MVMGRLIISVRVVIAIFLIRLTVSLREILKKKKNSITEKWFTEKNFLFFEFTVKVCFENP